MMKKHALKKFSVILIEGWVKAIGSFLLIFIFDIFDQNNNCAAQPQRVWGTEKGCWWLSPVKTLTEKFKEYSLPTIRAGRREGKVIRLTRRRVTALGVVHSRKVAWRLDICTCLILVHYRWQATKAHSSTYPFFFILKVKSCLATFYRKCLHNYTQ